MMEKAYEWDPISDLPDDWQQFRRTDLHLVRQQWIDEKSILKDPLKIQKLEDRLSTEWAIETGIIERLYTLDRGVTETLIELGLEALHQLHERATVPEPVARLIEDQREALEFVFQFVNQKRDLTLSYVKELHQLLTRHQDFSDAVSTLGERIQAPLRKGAWKLLPNNPVLPDGRTHEYCPPDFVQDEMEQLLKLHSEHDVKGIDAEIEAAWLHHRFTQIHPFQDGNGRIARALATLVFLRSQYLPLVIRDTEHREIYLDALEAADHGDLSPLIGLFAEIQLRDLTNAIATVRELRGEGIARIAASAAERVKLRNQESEQEAHYLTERLAEIAATRLAEVKNELELNFKSQDLKIDADIFTSRPETSTWWNFQLVDVARHYGYWADFSRFRLWVQLRLRLSQLGPTQSSIVVSFHHRGSISGLMVASAFLSASTNLSSGSQSSSSEQIASAEELETLPIGDRPFTYSFGARNTEELFRSWLDDVIEAALDKWQARI